MVVVYAQSMRETPTRRGIMNLPENYRVSTTAEAYRILEEKREVLTDTGYFIRRGWVRNAEIYFEHDDTVLGHQFVNLALDGISEPA